MARQAEIPQLATELYDLSKDYIEQEVVSPLRHTGRYLGLSLAGGGLLAIGWLLLAVAAVRTALGR